MFIGNELFYLSCVSDAGFVSAYKTSVFTFAVETLFCCKQGQSILQSVAGDMVCSKPCSEKSEGAMVFAYQ